MLGIFAYVPFEWKELFLNIVHSVSPLKGEHGLFTTFVDFLANLLMGETLHINIQKMNDKRTLKE